ncbi:MULTISPECIES: hypothetical protein [unclassified Halomonas]|uniref:hypothetical protein n=1 Tax=unclassified Halomonas TaxID=2609666 RepID=UPI00207676ED|nr:MULTISPECIES: hypothetical protein [unclassified Halomonas]
MLETTVTTIQRSTSKLFHIVIAGHEMPDMKNVDWDSITFLQAPFAPPGSRGKGWDKLKKRRLAAAWVKQHCLKRCRLAFADADDLISASLIDDVSKIDPAVSVVIDAGYRLDARNGDMELIADEFSRHCGSCFLPVFDKQELPDSWEDETTVFSSFDSHKEFYTTCQALDRAVMLLEVPSIIYLMNHEDSLEYAKKGMKENAVKKSLKLSQRDTILRNTFSCRYWDGVLYRV